MTDAATPPPTDEGPEVFLARWVAALEAALDLPQGSVPVLPVLDLTRDCARNVARPAGPVASYAAGYAQALADVAAHGAPAQRGSADAIPRAVHLALGWGADAARPGIPAPEAR